MIEFEEWRGKSILRLSYTIACESIRMFMETFVLSYFVFMETLYEYSVIERYTEFY